MTTILIADDHAVVRHGLQTLLINSGYTIVGDAADSDAAYQQWQQYNPDITILDIDMPGIGGLEVLARIQSRNNKALVIIFSMHEDGIYAARAIKCGAKGYVLKTDAPEVLLTAIKSALKGMTYISHSLAQVMAINQFNRIENPIEVLSPREFEIFKRLANGESLNKIAEQLFIGYKTVANVQTQIRHKLGIESTRQLVHLAIKHGVITGIISNQE